LKRPGSSAKEEQMHANPTDYLWPTCQCDDSGCSVHQAGPNCSNRATLQVYRWGVDYKDSPGRLRCEPCTDVLMAPYPGLMRKGPYFVERALISERTIGGVTKCKAHQIAGRCAVHLPSGPAPASYELDVWEEIPAPIPGLRSVPAVRQVRGHVNMDPPHLPAQFLFKELTLERTTDRARIHFWFVDPNGGVICAGQFRYGNLSFAPYPPELRY